MAADATRDERLVGARAAFGRHAWTEAYESLTAADAAAPLDAADLERRALAAYLVGRPDDSLATGARAHRSTSSSGSPRG